MYEKTKIFYFKIKNKKGWRDIKMKKVNNFWIDKWKCFKKDEYRRGNCDKKIG